MANLPAVGSGPLSVVDANGKQHDIPLSLISFGANNAITVSSSVPAAVQTLLAPLLTALVAEGALQPGAAPAPAPLFTITAAEAGSLGNSISVTFANPIGSPAAIDVTVTATEVYQGLTPTTLGTVLGTTAGSGTMPGLAWLSSAAPAMPIQSVTPFTLQAGVYTAAVPGANPNPPAFVLESQNTQADSALLRATISAVNTTASTFTLTIGWSKTVAGVLLANLNVLNTDFGFLLKFSPPPSGAPAGSYAPPAPGTIVLHGGTDPAAAIPAAAATAASATAVSG